MKMKNFLKIEVLTVVLALMGISHQCFSQLSILSANVNSFNITPASLLQVSIMNTAASMQAILETDLLSADNTLLLKVISNPFTLKKGVTQAGMNITVASAQYGTSTISTHIKTFHTLPSGKYHYCCTIKTLLHDQSSDQFCEDVESDNNSFMTLVFPADHDTIDSPMPLLAWSHSDPFNIASTGDYYKMIVVELQTGQSAEAAVSVNVPVYMKTSLMSHQVQYPYDARGLEVGKRYGWEVQKISNEVIVNRTEAWEFVLRPKIISASLKYAVLKSSSGSGYYVAAGDKLYFAFTEEYKPEGKVACKIIDDERKEILPKMKNEKGPGIVADNLKVTGDNRYVIDLDAYGLKSGFYTLEVANEKKQNFFLKFQIPK
jgi:hypothetical protein